MSIVIEINNLSKIYRLGQIGTGTINRDLERWFIMKIRRQEDPFLKIGETNIRNSKGASDVVYSLKDINLKVEQGKALGIIGKNGAGKSTLLKILSRVTSPTAGKIHIKGRVASLLEVGTGFHPELTGRENIYLNGAILGMRKKEITLKLDEIIDFSGVERYIETPVKRYSSGMYVRLAFAVAAHLESEILIVDEVLAVGDAEFQKKCLGKMGEVSKREGRTVLFVSHNMAAIKTLCETSMLIKNGTIEEIGKSELVVKHYLNETYESNSATIKIESHKPEQNHKKIVCKSVELLNSNKESKRLFSIGENIIIKFQIKNISLIKEIVKIAIEIKASDGTPICNMVDVDSGFSIGAFENEKLVQVELEDIRFYPDTYFIGIWLGDSTSIDTYEHLKEIISFEITDGGMLTSRHLPREAGLFFFTPKWKIVKE